VAIGAAESEHPVRRSSTSCAATASKSAHTRARETPGGCRPACHTGRGDGETDSARQTSAPQPTANGPTHSRAGCDAWPATARYAAPAAHVESPPRRSRGPQAHSPAAAAVAHVRRAAGESHQPTPRLLASRSGSRRSGESRAARRARRKSDDACSLAWPGRWDSDRSGHPRTPRGWNNCPRLPVTNQSGARERANPAGRSGSDPMRPPVCQSRRRRQHVIPDPHPSSCGSICQGMPLRRTKTMPVRHARSETRGRPPLGRRGRIGKSGSTRSHNG
jgi:hypothetical protein